jgi:hypothetical protein
LTKGSTHEDMRWLWTTVKGKLFYTLVPVYHASSWLQKWDLCNFFRIDGVVHRVCLGLLCSMFLSQIDVASQKKIVELWEHLKMCYRSSMFLWNCFTVEFVK